MNESVSLIDLPVPEGFTWAEAGPLIGEHLLTIEHMGVDYRDGSSCWSLGQHPIEATPMYFSRTSALHVLWMWARKNGKA